MFARMSRLTLYMTMLCIGIETSGTAKGGPTLMTPAGLSPGESFRFAFLTDGTTTATNPSIEYYNSFVTTQAGGATYNGSVVSWLAMGSTPDVDAITNIDQQPIVGVFLANGTIVTPTTTLAGLWSGQLENPIDLDLSSVMQPHSHPWTGTESNGTHAPDALGPLGLESLAGYSEMKNQFWVDFIPESHANSFPMYGISQVLVVPNAVPEPSTLLLVSTSLMAGLAFSWSRSRGAQRRQRPVGRSDTTG